MSQRITWRVPPSVERWLDHVPADAAVAVLLRHSVRGHLPHRSAGYGVPITPDGVRIARTLGAMLGPSLRTLHTSPVPRCVQTAEALRAGAASDLDIVPDRLLGDPGAYTIDGARAWPCFVELGAHRVIEHLVSQDEILPGMADPEPAARYLVQHMLAVADDRPGIHVFVTHDILVTTTVARLLDTTLGTDSWPWFLEGAFFWRDRGHLAVAYRDFFRDRGDAPLCSLTERDVIDFARREVARTIGGDCDARFFLAGGAFKSLLTGRPPRDLDIWAASDDDRARLIEVLTHRGTRLSEQPPFADAFEVADRVVEVPHHTEPTRLEARLARFDLGLSAVGAEHLPQSEWRAVVHPVARASFERREVLLLEPLVNWKYALATLDRARRYAAELGYVVPDHVETAIWSIFDAQPFDMKQGMLARFDRTAHGGFGVREEAVCRLR